jgi:hypothetical protein
VEQLADDFRGLVEIFSQTFAVAPIATVELMLNTLFD